MYYENAMKVTMKNENAAAAALEIMKTRLIAGFDCDKGYKRNPSMLMHDALEVIDNTIVLPKEFAKWYSSERLDFSHYRKSSPEAAKNRVRLSGL